MKPIRTLTIDCATYTTPDAVHAHIAKKLAFPTWYGENLDALADMLSELVLEHKLKLIWKDTALSKKDAALQSIKHTLLLHSAKL